MTRGAWSAPGKQSICPSRHPREVPEPVTPERHSSQPRDTLRVTLDGERLECTRPAINLPLKTPQRSPRGSPEILQRGPIGT